MHNPDRIKRFQTQSPNDKSHTPQIFFLEFLNHVINSTSSPLLFSFTPNLPPSTPKLHSTSLSTVKPNWTGQDQLYFTFLGPLPRVSIYLPLGTLNQYNFTISQPTNPIHTSYIIHHTYLSHHLSHHRLCLLNEDEARNVQII